MGNEHDEPGVAPRRRARRLARGLAKAGGAMRFLFGQPAWDAPPWARAVGRGVRRAGGQARANPARALALLATLLLTGGGGVALLRWWDHRPKPHTVALRVIAPELARIEEKIRPRPLRVEFDDSVAPLDKLDKPVTAGIELAAAGGGLLGGLAGRDPKRSGGSPEGIWTWTSDRELTFAPKTDWPVGQEFTVRLAKKGLVAKTVRLAKYELPFRTARFQARISQVEFHQDPVNPALKKVVATISFTHPVDPATFEKRVSLRLVPNDKEDAPSTYQAHITYDRWKGIAYVHSTPVQIPRHDAVFWVTVSPGTHAARGGPADERELTDKVVVPGLYNLLKVTSAQLSLVDNERYEPEQALLVETSVGVAPKDIARSLRATLLPEKTADGKAASWSNPESVSAADLQRGQPLALTAIASEAEYPVLHSFKVQAPVGRQLYVQVSKGLRAFGGYVLGEAFQTVVQVQPYPRMLRILQNGALLATSGDRKLPLLARDIPAVKYEIGRVLPGQIQHLISQSYGDFGHPGWSYKFDQNNLAEFFEEVHRLKATTGKPEYDALDLSKYLTGSGNERRGLFLLRAQSWDPVKRQLLGETDSRLVLVSDLGVLVKENADGSHDVFVTSIRSGDAVSSARVEVLGKNGQRVLEATTDGDGHARLGTFADLRREKEPTLYLVTTGRDQSFLPIGRGDRMLDTSRFDVGGVREEPTSGDARGLTAFLFSDRGIYRPGDEIRVGLIVKAKDWSTRLEGLPLQVVVTDARGLTVKDQRIKLSSAGFEELRHTTPEIAPAGSYGVNVYVVKDGNRSNLLGSTTVVVREFLPDRMKIHAALTTENPRGWVAPMGLHARVSLSNLFGTPAASRKVRVKMTLSPWVPAFAHAHDYRFFDPLKPREGVSETLADATTNDEGVANIDLGLQRFAAATYRLSLTVEGFEADGGRSVVADVGAVVSPLPFLVGTKADGDLTYMPRGVDRSVELVALGPGGGRVKADGLYAVLLERKYVSVLARQHNGTYRYQSVKKEVELSSKAMEIAAAGSRRKLPTDKPGDFTLVIRDAQDRELQRVEFSVTGYGNLSREVEKNAELQVALKRSDLAPGDEIEMQIKAPYTGTGLITIERDRVYSWKWFRTSTTATIERIRVPENLEGGGYVSVAFVRDPASDELFMSPLSHGIVPFSISRARRQVKVELDIPDQARPGEPLPIKVRADKPAKVVVFAVDEGILRVADHKTPDPLGFFFQKRALSVRTAQILDLILPEFQRLVSAAAPGGDMDAAVGANLNPFRRKQQKPVAFWSGIVDAGPKEREIVYQVPDSFNGTLRVMAVAVAPEALGSAERRAIVRGDFVLSPNVPAFLAPGDEAEVSVSVANNVSGSGGATRPPSVTVAVAPTGGIEVIGPAERQVAVAEMREASTMFKVRARAPVGPATLVFTARLGNARARLAGELSIRPAVPYLATFQAGHLRDGGVSVPVARKLHGELRRAEAGISPLPLGLTHGLRGYLEKFPHGCTEQVVSQVVPALVLGRRPEFGYSAQTSGAAVEKWIGVLRARQNDEGAFGRWAANPAIDKLATVWATHMLMEAKERGFAVPAEMLKTSTAYLQTLAASDVEGLSEGGLRAYATYVLTVGGMMTGPFAAAQEKHLQANHPKEWRRALAGLYLAATHQLLKQERPARDIIAGVQFGQPRAADADWTYDRLGYDAQALYLIARHFPERAARVTPQEIDAIVDPIFRGAYHTYSSAWSILALEAYAAAATGAGDGSRSVAIKEIVGGQPRALSLPQSLLPVAAFSPQATAMRFEATGPFGAYWVLAEAGFDAQVPAAPEARGVEIFRTYETADGKPATSVKLGEELTAIVRVRSLGKDFINQLAIVDLLPGGFDPVVRAAPPTAAAGDPEAEGEGNDGAGEGEGYDEGGGEGEGESEGESAGSHQDNQGAPASALPSPGEAVAAANSYPLSIALPGATFPLEFGDVREDRVVLYGSAGKQVKELRYAIKATNVGVYVVPPIQATAMYDSTIRARGAGGKLTVVPRTP